MEYVTLPGDDENAAHFVLRATETYNDNVELELGVTDETQPTPSWLFNPKAVSLSINAYENTIDLSGSEDSATEDNRITFMYPYISLRRMSNIHEIFGLSADSIPDDIKFTVVGQATITDADGVEHNIIIDNAVDRGVFNGVTTINYIIKNYGTTYAYNNDSVYNNSGKFTIYNQYGLETISNGNFAYACIKYYDEYKKVWRNKRVGILSSENNFVNFDISIYNLIGYSISKIDVYNVDNVLALRYNGFNVSTVSEIKPYTIGKDEMTGFNLLVSPIKNESVIAIELNSNLDEVHTLINDAMSINLNLEVNGKIMRLNSIESKDSNTIRVGAFTSNIYELLNYTADNIPTKIYIKYLDDAYIIDTNGNKHYIAINNRCVIRHDDCTIEIINSKLVVHCVNNITDLGIGELLYTTLYFNDNYSQDNSMLQNVQGISILNDTDIEIDFSAVENTNNNINISSLNNRIIDTIEFMNDNYDVQVEYSVDTSNQPLITTT